MTARTAIRLEKLRCSKEGAKSTEQLIKIIKTTTINYCQWKQNYLKRREKHGGKGKREPLLTLEEKEIEKQNYVAS